MKKILSIKYAECFDKDCSKNYEVVYSEKDKEYKLTFTSKGLLTNEQILTLLK